jgi:hypothetical protein
LFKPPAIATPKNPPIDLVLHLIGKLETGSVDAAGLLDAIVVAWKAEAGAQAKAAQIEPAQLECRRLAAALGKFKHPVGQAANRAERPGIPCLARASVPACREFLGRERAGLESGVQSALLPERWHASLTTAAGFPARPLAVLRNSNCKSPVMIADFGIGPNFERAHLREMRAQFHRHQPLARFAETDDGIQRGMQMQIARTVAMVVADLSSTRASELYKRKETGLLATRCRSWLSSSSVCPSSAPRGTRHTALLSPTPT